MSKKNFIKTSDKEIWLLLKKEGYTELSKEGDKLVFLNDRDFKFSSYDLNNMEFTNQMHI